jgi:hypothetical protein
MTYLTVASRGDDVKLVAQGLKNEEWFAIEALFPADNAAGASDRTGAQATSPKEDLPDGPNRS